MVTVNLTTETRIIWNTAVVFVITTIDAFIFALSLTGNTLIIAVVVKNVNMRTTMNLFVVNIAVSDLLATIFPLPFQMIDIVADRWPFHQESTAGLFLCKMTHATWVLSSSVSLGSLVVITLDRFWAVFFPTKRRSVLTRRLSVTFAVIWLMYIAFALHFFNVTEIYEKKDTTVCFQKKTTILWLLFSIHIVEATVVIFVLYPAILIRLWKRKLPGNPSTANQEIRDRTNRKVTYMAVSLMIAFFVSWFPFLVVSLKIFIEKGNVERLLPSMMYLISRVFTYTSCACNPFICLTFNNNIRRGLKELLRTFFSACCSGGNCFSKNHVENFPAQVIELADIQVIGIARIEG